MKFKKCEEPRDAFSLSQGEFLKYFASVREDIKADSNLEHSLKELCDILVQNGELDIAGNQFEVVPLKRKYIVRQGNKDIYQVQ